MKTSIIFLGIALSALILTSPAYAQDKGTVGGGGLLPCELIAIELALIDAGLNEFETPATKRRISQIARELKPFKDDADGYDGYIGIAESITAYRITLSSYSASLASISEFSTDCSSGNEQKRLDKLIKGFKRRVRIGKQRLAIQARQLELFLIKARDKKNR